jgi:hypothetical protein
VTFKSEVSVKSKTEKSVCLKVQILILQCTTGKMF